MTDGEKLIPINIEEQMKSAYIDYSMSVIVSRALPDVRDGLKPVHRRVLYGMHELGIKATGSYKKSARIVGEVLGKYHPHGDTSVYDSMVRMAQSWSQRYMMVDGQGNFGSVDGDSPAAMRYTEVRMQKISEDMLSDIEKDTVEHRLNFDDTLEEPTVLPTRIPNLLVNGASGIAVGMATNMAPHNLTEVVNGTLAYIENRDIEIDELMQHVKAPDFPTGGIIYGYEGVKDAFHTGRGRIVMRAKAVIEEVKGRECIIVTEIPYQVNKADMIKKTAELVNDKKLEGIANIRDESDRNGMRVVYVLKRDAIPNIVLNKLYKYTALQTSFSVNNIALVNGRPEQLNLKQLIHYFVEHRHEVVVRRTKFELKKAEARAHILEGLIIASDNIDEVIKLIRGSKNGDEEETKMDASLANDSILNLLAKQDSTNNALNNDLMSLDIRNNTLLANMDIRTNPNLTCVLVTDVDAANSNAGFNKDPGTIYSLDCLTTVTAEFSQTLGEDFEANGGNLPKLLVTGTITNATSITVQDITTDVNVVVGEDYTFNNPTVINIPIGVYDGTLNTAIDIPGLAVLDDVDFESRAELNFQLNNFTGDITGFGSVTTTAYNISNDDYTAVVVATDLEASEEGLEVAGFAILLDGAVDSGVTVNVNYTITGSATNAVDYEELSGSVEILEGTNDATITIIPRQDPDVEGTEDLIITLSGGALYRIGDPSEASIEILDNDVAGTPSFILSKNIVATAEPNGSDSFTIVLNQQPATDVVIDIVSDNMGEAITDLSSLTFSNTDWDTPQTVTVIGQDDAVVDGTQNYVLTLSVNPAASDDVFDLVENQTVNGTNTDDEVAGTPGFTLSKNTVATAEPNGSDSFTVVLNTQPTSDVVIDIISNDLGEAIVAPTSLTFSNANWNIPQTLTVTGQDDVIVDGTQNYALTLSINDAASDDAYDALADQTVSGTNADDEVDDSIPEIEQEDIKVFVKNATCKDIDNGEIQVDVFANYTFSVSLNDSNSAGTVTPGNPLILNNLANGPYNVCLSISEFPNWQQCFTSTITNFEDLVADILNVDSAEQSALISLQGSKSYKVNVNDITYNYDFDDISLKTQKIPLESGTNKVTIQGHSDCQGIFSEEITIAAMKYYPNPATEEVSIDGLPINEVLQFKIFSSTGKLVLSDFKETLNGKIRVDLKSLSAGFYFMKLSAKAGFFEYKILKK